MEPIIPLFALSGLTVEAGKFVATLLLTDREQSHFARVSKSIVTVGDENKNASKIGGRTAEHSLADVQLDSFEIKTLGFVAGNESISCLQNHSVLQ